MASRGGRGSRSGTDRAKVIAALEERVSGLQGSAARLCREQRSILHQQAILVDLIRLLKSQAGSAAVWCQLTDHDAAARIAELEALVESQQQQLPGCLSAAMLDLVGLSDGDDEPSASQQPGSSSASSSRLQQRELRAAPRSNPLLIHCSVLERPPYPGQPGLEAVQARYAHFTRELALNLAKHESGSRSEPSPVARIAELVIDWLHFISSLAMQHQEHVANAHVLTNCESTKEAVEEPNRTLHVDLLERLGLSDCQLSDMADTLTLCTRLLRPVVEEERRLTAMLARSQAEARPGSPTATSVPNAAAAAAAPSPAPPPPAVTLGAPSPPGTPVASEASEPGAAVEGLWDRSARLEQQEQAVQRLRVLHSKTWWIKTWAGNTVFGCLSWPQIARLVVWSHPFPPCPYLLADVAGQRLEAQLAAAASTRGVPSASRRQRHKPQAAPPQG